MPKLYKLTPEHEARLPEWRDRWIANAMSTEAMTEADRAVCREAVLGLYAAAKLPAPKHIVFVPSPFVLSFAGGFAAARWHWSKNTTYAATCAATYDATCDATYDATCDATYDATYDATCAATYDATDAATYDATVAATVAATCAATCDADLNNWYLVPGDMHRCADELGVGDFGLRCATQALRVWQGGNQWSYWESFLTFFQDVAKLPLDYSAYNHWRALSEHSGPRIVHPDFCMISDRPEVLTVDDQNRPHNESGAFCRWRDGSELYSWHGTRLPARWVLERETIAPDEILRETDVDVRTAGLDCIGLHKLKATHGKLIHDSGDPVTGSLWEIRLPDLPEPGLYLSAQCPRNGEIFEGVMPVSNIDGLPIRTAEAAQAWRRRLPACEFEPSPYRT